MSEVHIPKWLEKIAWHVEDLISDLSAMTAFQAAVNHWVQQRSQEQTSLEKWRQKRQWHLEKALRDPSLRYPSKPPGAKWTQELQYVQIKQCWLPRNLIRRHMPRDPKARGKAELRRESFLSKAVPLYPWLLNKRKKMKTGWIWSTLSDLPIIAINSWMPPGLRDSDKPQVKKLLPLEQRKPLTMVEKYVCLSVAHDLVCPVKGVERISLWPSENGAEKEAFDRFLIGLHYTIMISADSFRNSDREAFRRMLKDVTRDLESKGLAKPSDEWKKGAEIAAEFGVSKSWITQLCNLGVIKTNKKKGVQRLVSLKSALYYFATARTRRPEKKKPGKK